VSSRYNSLCSFRLSIPRAFPSECQGWYHSRKDLDPLSKDTHAWSASVHKAVTLVDAEVAVVASTNISGRSLVGEKQASPPRKPTRKATPRASPIICRVENSPSSHLSIVLYSTHARHLPKLMNAQGQISYQRIISVRVITMLRISQYKC